MMRMFLLEVRRSPMRWCFPFLVFIDLAMLFGRSTDWIGIWPQASAAAQLPVFYFSLLLASGAAWSAGRKIRAASPEQFLATAQPQWKQELAMLLATVLYGLIPLTLGAGVAAAYSYRLAGPGFLWPSYLILGAILVVIGASVGHLCGRLIRSRVTAPLMAPAVAFILVSIQPIPWLQLIVLSGAPQIQVEPGALLTRAAFALALAVAAVTINRPSLEGRSWPGHSGALSHAVVTALAIGLVAVTVASAAVAGPLRTYRTPPDEPLCSRSAPRICVWPEHRVHLSRLAAIGERLGALSPAVTVPEAFYEEGLRAPIGANSDFAVVLGDWAAARGMVSTVIDLTLGVKRCAPPTDEVLKKNTMAWIELKEWLVTRAYGPKPSDIHGGFEYDEAGLARVLALPEAQQAQWARERIDFIQETRCG